MPQNLEKKYKLMKNKKCTKEQFEKRVDFFYQRILKGWEKCAKFRKNESKSPKK